MIDYGDPPTVDEVEVTLFGPGFGEAVAVHWGYGSWLLVDSCLNPVTKAPATAEYLDNIGVGVNQVRTIVASHWHDDHVRGLSTLVSKYSDADFVVSAVFNDKEAAAFLSAYGDAASTGITGGAKELFKSYKYRDSVSFALHKSLVVDDPPIKITALSPMHGAFAQSTAHFAQYLPKKGGSINYAPAIKENHEAVVLHIDLGDDAILLGSDLENHESFGWPAVIADKWSGSRRCATAYKVAHHGSKSGDCSQLWSSLLCKEPVSCLTPWVLAGNRLPTDADKLRVKKNSSSAYTVSDASRRPQMESHQLKRLSDIAKNIYVANSGFGAVRLRKRVGESMWRAELFGSARPL